MGKLWLSLVGLLVVISVAVSGCATQTTSNSIINTSAIVYVPNAVVEEMWYVSGVDHISWEIYFSVTIENTMSCKTGDQFVISLISLDTNQTIEQRTLTYNGTRDASNLVGFDINGNSYNNLYQELFYTYFSNNASEVYHFDHGESPIQYIKFSTQKQN